MGHLVFLSEVNNIVAECHDLASRTYDNASALYDATRDDKKREQFKSTMREQNAIMTACEKINSEINNLTRHDDKPPKAE